MERVEDNIAYQPAEDNIAYQPQVSFEPKIARTHFYSNKTSILPTGDSSMVVTSASIKKSFKLDKGRRNNSKIYLCYDFQPSGTLTDAVALQNLNIFLPADHISEIQQVKYISSNFAVPPVDLSSIPFVTKQQCPLSNDYTYRNGSKRINFRSKRSTTEANQANDGDIPVTGGTTDASQYSFNVEYIDDPANSILVGSTSGASAISPLTKTFMYALRDILPNTQFGLDYLLDYEADETLEIWFSPSSATLYTKKNAANGGFTVPISDRLGYTVTNLRLRYWDEQSLKNISFSPLDPQVIYIPYVDYEQLPLNNTGKQQLSFVRGGMSGYYLTSMFISAFHQDCFYTGGNTAGQTLPFSAFSSNQYIPLSNTDSGLYSDKFAKNLNNSSFDSLDIELNGTKIVQLLDQNDILGYLNQVLDKKETSITGDQVKLMWGCIPVFFDIDVYNFDKYNMNIAKGLELTNTHTFKISPVCKQFLSSSKNVIFCSFVILKPMIYMRGKFMEAGSS